MAMLEVLPEVIRSVKLLGRVALPKLVHVLQVSNALFPILFRGVPGRDAAAEAAAPDGVAGPGKLVPAVTTGVGLPGAAGRVVEGTVVSREG